MSLRLYTTLEDSGVEWLGKLPSHWRITRLKNLFDPMNRPPQADDEIVTAFRDGEVTLRRNRRVEGFTNAIHEHGYQRVHAGDLVIHAMDAFAGAIGVSDSTGKATPVYAVCKPKSSAVNARYYGYLLRHMALSGYVNSLSKGIRERSTDFRWKEAANVRVAVPPSEEQQAIISFLNVQLRQLEQLVSEQQQLIQLLKEKRQAVISHAVTKGLNPDAPMKASSVEWLGDVPAHWDIGPIKRFFSFLDGRRVPLSAEERSARQGEVPYYGASGVIDFVDDWLFGEDLVLVSEDGANLINRSSPIAFVATGRFWVNNHAHILKPADDNLVFWAERIEAVNLVPFVTGSAQPKLTVEALSDIKIAVPPTPTERAEIQARVLNASKKIDALRMESERAIALLQERRTALISAVVTGKIDVRHLADAEAA